MAQWCVYIYSNLLIWNITSDYERKQRVGRIMILTILFLLDYSHRCSIIFATHDGCITLYDQFSSFATSKNLGNIYSFSVEPGPKPTWVQLFDIVRKFKIICDLRGHVLYAVFSSLRWVLRRPSFPRYMNDLFKHFEIGHHLKKTVHGYY